jgi:drug/metabolite transporter (DMT)-like permease
MGASVQILAAGVALTLAGTLKGEWPGVHFNGRTFAALAYLIVFGSIVSFSAYNYAIQKLPLSFVSMYSYINPVIAVILGWLLVSEPLNWRIALATTVILCGVALVKGKKKKEKEKPVIEEIEASSAGDSCTATS